MQPSPTAETSGPRVPSLRFCIAPLVSLPPGRTIELALHREPAAYRTFSPDDASRSTTRGSLLRLSRSLEVVRMIDRWVIEAARQRVWRKGDFVENAPRQA
jgi:hypothetical protein